eukprot:12894926-Prorocentrum_lima.AAC.1
MAHGDADLVRGRLQAAPSYPGRAVNRTKMNRNPKEARDALVEAAKKGRTDLKLNPPSLHA